ncbi:hypothetical protein GGR58DRAFT_472317 [Xylaria digitata]|nr:hypothetical protein GGR58DRAFT_472317 [Xylaria digitata]
MPFHQFLPIERATVCLGFFLNSWSAVVVRFLGKLDQRPLYPDEVTPSPLGGTPLVLYKWKGLAQMLHFWCNAEESIKGRQCS